MRLVATLASSPTHRYSNSSLHGQPSSLWAFSSGGERFPDTEEVTSSNLVTPTTYDEVNQNFWLTFFLMCAGCVQINNVQIGCSCTGTLIRAIYKNINVPMGLLDGPWWRYHRRRSWRLDSVLPDRKTPGRQPRVHRPWRDQGSQCSKWRPSSRFPP